MNTLVLSVKPKQSARQRRFVVSVDADRLERLAANFGMFNPDFLASVDRAERDYQTGRVRRVGSLRELIR